MPRLETITIDDGKGGFKIINKSDFDPKVDKEFKAKATQKPRKKKEE